MDLFTLSASLGLNITNYETGIGKARRLLQQFATSVVDFGKDVVNTGMNFDKQMSAVQAVMGLTENTTENMGTMNKLRKEALEQARDSIFTSEEVATAYYYMGMAGWDAEQMMSGLPGVISLAAASGEDLKMTSDMVTDSLTAFGLGAGQATHFADVLAVTATNANTDVGRMQQTFKNLAPIAGSLGYSIEDVALSVGLIANSGIKGSQAGTALRNIFTRVATNAGSTSKTLGALQIVTDKLGVSFYDAEGRARPWGEVLTDLRTAWNKLDPSGVNEVTTAFGNFSAESQSADEIMAEFASDLDTWTTEWNGLTTAVEREEFASKLESQFSVLGISMRDSSGNLREFSAVARDAQVKLGGLTDQEQIYYGKQIGSLRGISGWLALMTASEEDVNQLTTAIQNADGAAQAMADTRLNNLWGDVKLFNAELDVLKIAIFDDVKSPLIDLVEYGTSALKNITDAVNENGLLGGIKQLGTEIKNFSEEYKDEIEALGEALVPLIEAFVTSVVPAFAGAATTLGSSFASGLLTGISNELSKSDNPLLSSIGASLISGLSGAVSETGAIPDAVGSLLTGFGRALSNTGDFSGLAESLLTGVSGATSGAGKFSELAKAFCTGFTDAVFDVSDVPLSVASLFTGSSNSSSGAGELSELARSFLEGLSDELLGAEEIPSVELTGNVVIDENNIWSAIRDAILKGDKTIRIDNYEVDLATAEEAVSEHIDGLSNYLSTKTSQGFSEGSASGIRDLLDAVVSNMPTVRSLINNAISGGGASGAISMVSSVTTNMVTGASNVLRTLSSAIGQAGTDGGNTAVSNVNSQFYRRGADLKNTLANSLGSAGSSAGKGIASGVQRELNLWKFGISLVGTLTGVFSGSKKYASAMHAGRILNGATIFGTDNKGNALVGGEAGPEAVIGTNALSKLISNAVSAGSKPTNYVTININQQPGQDPRELVEIIQRELVRIGRQQKAVYV